MLPNRVGCASTFDSFRRYLRHPAKNKRNRQTNNDEHDNQTNYPIRNVEDRKDLRNALGKGPTRDDVRDRNLVDIAPLQLGEEGVIVHYENPRCQGHSIFLIFTMLPFACESFGSFTTVTYSSSSFLPKAMLVVPSPAAISKTWRSLPSGDIFKILPPNHWAT